MNQILDYGENEQKTSLNQENSPMQSKSMEDYYQKPNTVYQPNFNNANSDKRTIKIFAIALGIFAIVSIIIAIGLLIITSKKQKKLPELENIIPKILMVENEDKVQITATYEQGNLEELIYSWGTNPDQIIPGTGSNTITATINKPEGTYLLKVTVIAQDGKRASEEKEYTQEIGPDIEKPTIDFQITDTKKLKITVRDNVEIKTFKYFWNDEQPTELADGTGGPEASVELEILKGRNKITVIAIDKAGNEKIEEKEYTGKVAPTITMYQTEDKKNVKITVKHEKGISEIVTIINGIEDKKTYEGDLVKTEISLIVNLKSGTNIVEVRTVSVDGETTIKKGSAEGLIIETEVLQTQN